LSSDIFFTPQGCDVTYIKKFSDFMSHNIPAVPMLLTPQDQSFGGPDKQMRSILQS
jgi:hypothetical protein